MSTLGEYSSAQLSARLSGDGIRLRVGPYTYAIQSDVSLVREGLAQLYPDFPLAADDGFADFHINLCAPDIWQRLRGKLEFYFDNQRPFNRVEARHAYAFFEWGLNWCVSVTANEYLKLHAAVVAKDDVAVILPGLPGSGKSTLCAALALTGWRVLSDEHALIPLGSSQVVPLYRPVSLKNDSIPLIKSFSPGAVFGPQTNETHKGVVAHLKADLHPHSHNTEPLSAKFIVYPQYATDASLSISPRHKAESFMFAGHHSFNYSVLSEEGFGTLAALTDSAESLNLRYGNLEQGLRAVERLVDGGYGA